jgi:hypothetical protein
VRLTEAVCAVGAAAGHVDEVVACVAYLDAVVRYGGVPLPCLRACVHTLCRTVNVDEYVRLGATAHAACVSIVMSECIRHGAHRLCPRKEKEGSSAGGPCRMRPWTVCVCVYLSLSLSLSLSFCLSVYACMCVSCVRRPTYLLLQAPCWSDCVCVSVGVGPSQAAGRCCATC